MTHKHFHLNRLNCTGAEVKAWTPSFTPTDSQKIWVGMHLRCPIAKNTRVGSTKANIICKWEGIAFIL